MGKTYYVVHVCVADEDILLKDRSLGTPPNVKRKFHTWNNDTCLLAANGDALQAEAPHSYGSQITLHHSASKGSLQEGSLEWALHLTQAGRMKQFPFRTSLHKVVGVSVVSRKQSELGLSFQCRPRVFQEAQPAEVNNHQITMKCRNNVGSGAQKSEEQLPDVLVIL